jgi:hypothetical protein
LRGKVSRYVHQKFPKGNNYKKNKFRALHDIPLKVDVDTYENHQIEETPRRGKR